MIQLYWCEILGDILAENYNNIQGNVISYISYFISKQVSKTRQPVDAMEARQFKRFNAIIIFWWYNNIRDELQLQCSTAHAINPRNAMKYDSYAELWSSLYFLGGLQEELPKMMAKVSAADNIGKLQFQISCASHTRRSQRVVAWTSTKESETTILQEEYISYVLLGDIIIFVDKINRDTKIWWKKRESRRIKM